MVRDGVANIVSRLRECGFDPRKVGQDAWESRCPGHRSLDHALSITRNEFNHVVLNCRSAENCTHLKVIRAVGFTNDQLYAETPDWLISRLRRIAVEPEERAEFTSEPPEIGEPANEAASRSCFRPPWIGANVESRCDAVVIGSAYLLPALSVAGASLASP